MSETDSISSSHTVESDFKEKSKIWTEEEIELLRLLLNKYGTDFHILSSFFPKKTKNQIKVMIFVTQNKYKQLASMKKKEDKAEGQTLMAVAQMFERELDPINEN